MSDKSDIKKVKFSAKLCVGGSAGLIGTSIVYPLDMIKTRLQRQVVKNGVKQYKGVVHCFNTILKTEGFRGFYAGLGANLIGVVPEKAIKLAVNDGLREYWTDPNGHVSLFHGIVAGGAAGLFQVFATNPMEITKIKMQIQAKIPPSERTPLLQIYKQLGLKGLYKGASLCWCRDIPYSMLFFPLNSYTKTFFAQDENNVPMYGLMISGIVAGSFSAGLFTPFDVMKTRTQAQEGNKMKDSIITLMKKIYIKEGFGAFFKGAIPRMAVQAPLYAIALTAFELQKRYIMWGSFRSHNHLK